jgi:hypothetical protein
MTSAKAAVSGQAQRLQKTIINYYNKLYNMPGILLITTTIVSAYIYLFIVFILFTIGLKIYILNCLFIFILCI